MRPLRTVPRALASAALAAALALGGCGQDSPGPNPAGSRPWLGLTPSTRSSGSIDSLLGAIQTARATGADLYCHTIPWSSFEYLPNEYDVQGLEALFNYLHLLGFTTSVNLAVINTNVSGVPPDLQGRGWDDPLLATRLDRAVDTLLSVMRRYPCASLAIGNEVDAWFATRPTELDAFRALYGQQVLRVHAAVPGLPVGVCTIAPPGNPNAAIGAYLNTLSDVVIYTYYPMQPGSDFTHRPPSVLEADFDAMAAAAGSKPWALQEIGYSSSAANGSSPALQAEFLARFRNRLATSSRAKLRFANWFHYTDWDADTIEELVTYYGYASPGFRAYLGNLGLRDSLGVPKPAWDVWRSAP